MSGRGRGRRAAVLAALLAAGGPAAALTLDDCLRAALAENPEAQAAAHRAAAAQALLDQARSAAFPRLGLAASYTQTDNAGQGLFLLLNQRRVDFQSDLNRPGDVDNLRASITGQWRVWDFGRRRLDTAMARLAEEAARAALAAARNRLAHEVTRGFYGALQARAFVAVQEESVRSIEESLRIARERFGAGSTVKTDVLNLEVQLAQAREDLIRARHGVQLAVAGLNAAIGRELARAEDLDEPPADALPAPPEQNDLTALDTQRPELKAATLLAAAQREKLRRARRDYLPLINAFGSLDRDDGDGGGAEDSYFAGVAAELNVFDAGQTRAAVAQAAAEWRAAESERRKARNELRLDATQAYLGARDAWERMGVMERSLDNAREALRVTQAQYQQGAADIGTLLAAQAGLTATRMRAAAAHYDYRIALSNLKRARGELAPPEPKGRSVPAVATEEP